MPMCAHTTVLDYLEEIIQINHITLIHVSGTIYDPDVVNSQKRVIIINRSFQTSFSYYFRIAHEISHLLSDRQHDTYNFSQLSKSTAEKQANLQGIKILADYYFTDEQSQKARWERRFAFIETFKLGPLTHLVEKVLNPIKKQ